MTETNTRTYIQEEIDLGLRDAYGAVYGGCEDEVRERFYARNDDEALLEAIYEADARLAQDSDDEEGAPLREEMGALLQHLREYRDARDRLRTRPLEQVELGIASNADDSVHPLFTPEA